MEFMLLTRFNFLSLSMMNVVILLVSLEFMLLMRFNFLFLNMLGSQAVEVEAMNVLIADSMVVRMVVPMVIWMVVLVVIPMVVLSKARQFSSFLFWPRASSFFLFRRLFVLILLLWSHFLGVVVLDTKQKVKDMKKKQRAQENDGFV